MLTSRPSMHGDRGVLGLEPSSVPPSGGIDAAAAIHRARLGASTVDNLEPALQAIRANPGSAATWARDVIETSKFPSDSQVRSVIFLGAMAALEGLGDQSGLRTGADGKQVFRFPRVSSIELMQALKYGANCALAEQA